MGPVLPTLAALAVGGLVGWALVRWTNIAIARLWAIALLLVAIGMIGVGLVRGGEGGIGSVVLATLVVFPAMIGSVVAMVLTEWRMTGK